IASPAPRRTSARSPATIRNREPVEQPARALHPSEDDRRALRVDLARRSRMPRLRLRQARRVLRRFEVRERCGALAEVVARRGLRAIEAAPELGDVEVQLQDARLLELL